MCDRWMPTIQLPLTLEQFHQLPRNPDYKYEFLGGRAVLSPNARHYHALLDLRTLAPPAAELANVQVRRLEGSDFEELEHVFTASFRSMQPYGSLDEATRLRAAHDALERARTGGDGPWIGRASFVTQLDRRITGAIMITLLPKTDPCDWNSYHWKEPPPHGCIEQRLGRPHLTWIFVAPHLAGHGAGTTLLHAAARELHAMGYEELLTTFLSSNQSSMLWHWRNGFRLLAHPGTKRRG